LAYTNKKVISYNQFIRRLYTQSPHFIEGELITTSNPVIKAGRTVIPGDFTLEIEEIVHSKSEEGVEGMYIKFKGLKHLQSLFCPYNPHDSFALLKHYAKHKNWGAYFKIKNEYLDIRSPHALTCHKSQGSTFREVFIDLSDISKNNKWYEVARLVYVAITRASHTVYVYGELKNRWVN
jgi:hypothetical protein